jgi:hypothetical protein
MSENRPRRRRRRPERRPDRDLNRGRQFDQRVAAPGLASAESVTARSRHGDLDAHELPHETLTPITLAAGIALLGFGVLTSPLFSVVGIAVMGWALWRWIGEMQHG